MFILNMFYNKQIPEINSVTCFDILNEKETQREAMEIFIINCENLK